MHEVQHLHRLSSNVVSKYLLRSVWRSEVVIFPIKASDYRPDIKPLHLSLIILGINSEYCIHRTKMPHTPTRKKNGLHHQIWSTSASFNHDRYVCCYIFKQPGRYTSETIFVGSRLLQATVCVLLHNVSPVFCTLSFAFKRSFFTKKLFGSRRAVVNYTVLVEMMRSDCGTTTTMMMMYWKWRSKDMWMQLQVRIMAFVVYYFLIFVFGNVTLHDCHRKYWVQYQRNRCILIMFCVWVFKVVTNSAVHSVN